MLKMAAENAIDREKENIEPEDFHYSVNRLKTDYYNAISYNEETGLSAGDYYNIMVDCIVKPDKRTENVAGLMDLKYNMCIWGHTNEKWLDVHPVVRLILKEKRMIK